MAIYVVKQACGNNKLACVYLGGVGTLEFSTQGYTINNIFYDQNNCALKGNDCAVLGTEIIASLSGT